MNDPLAQLKKRLQQRVSDMLYAHRNTDTFTYDVFNDLLAWHEVQAVTRERAAYERGWERRHQQTIDSAIYQGARSDIAYPWPSRERAAPREEPVSPTEYPEILYRVVGGKVERKGPLSGGWEAYRVADADRPNLLRHLADLHDRPTRTKRVPVDENNPWGDT